MEDPKYIYHNLLFEQAPAAIEYFGTRAKECFASQESQAQLSLYRESGSSGVVSQPNKNDGDQPELDMHRTTSDAALSTEDFDSKLPLTLLDIQSRKQLAKLADVRDDKMLQNSASDLHVAVVWRDHSLVRIHPNHEETVAECKYSFIEQRSSRSRLSIPLDWFVVLLESYRIPKQILNFACCFGLQSGETELSPPPLLFRWHPAQIKNSFDCAYVIRFVELNHRGEQNPWSLRQSLIIQRAGNSPLMIFIALSKTMRREVNLYLSRTAGLTRHPFTIHLIVLSVAAATWHPYLVYIAEEVRELAERAILADFGQEAAYLTELQQRQYLKQLEDMVMDVSIAVDAALDVCAALEAKYEQFEGNMPSDGRPLFQARSIETAQLLVEKKRELHHQRSQADQILHRVRSAENLVTNILELGNGTALKDLGVEAQTENRNMRLLTDRSIKDTAAVKVITVVTVVYLPTTAVLNFFSTAFVDNSHQSNSGSPVSVASNWWISLAIAGPLTAVTLYIWWFYVQVFINERPPKWWLAVCKASLHFPWTEAWRKRRSAHVCSELPPV